MEKLQQSREREQKYESMLRAGMQLFANKMGLNLNNLSNYFPDQTLRKPMLMIEDKKIEETQTSKSIRKNTDAPVSVKVPRLKLPEP